MTKIQILKELKESLQIRNTYIDSLPKDLDCIFDNQLISQLNTDILLLMKELFKQETYGIEWFLYEFSEDLNRTEPNIIENGVSYIIRTNDEYYDYLLNTNYSYWNSEN